MVIQNGGNFVQPDYSIYRGSCPALSSILQARTKQGAAAHVLIMIGLFTTQACKLVLAFPVITAERSSSSRRRIKTFLRNSDAVAHKQPILAVSSYSTNGRP